MSGVGAPPDGGRVEGTQSSGNVNYSKAWQEVSSHVYYGS